MLSFKAAILVEQKKPLEVVTLTHYGQLDTGQVLVDIKASGICGSQLGEIDGAKGPDRYLPHMLGHEGAGIVKAVGAGVKTVNVGDTVVLHWRQSQGIEAVLPKYQWGDRVVNAGWVTTFAEQSIISENRLTVIPADTNMDLAALYGCAVTTGFGVAINDAEIKPGESAVVMGAGGVGLNIIQAMAMSTAHPIIAVDLFDNRLRLAKLLGATHTINASACDVQSEIQNILHDQDLDVFVDNTGQPQIISMGYNLVCKTGRAILVGVPKAGADVTLHTLPLHFGKVLKGSHGGDALPEKDIPKYMRLEALGKVDFTKLISKVYSLDHINDAIADMRNGTLAGRCIIRM